MPDANLRFVLPKGLEVTFCKIIGDTIYVYGRNRTSIAIYATLLKVL